MRKIIRRAAAVLLSAALLLTGTASAAAQIDPVEERLAAMSLREKVGQLFVVRVEALDPSGQSDSTRLTSAECEKPGAVEKASGRFSGSIRDRSVDRRGRGGRQRGPVGQCFRL